MNTVMVGGFVLYICLYGLVFNELMPAHSFSDSALVGQSWRPAGQETEDNVRSWVIGKNLEAQILLSTVEGCAFISSQGLNHSFKFPKFGFGFISVPDDNELTSYTLGVFMGSDLVYDQAVIVWYVVGDHPFNEDANLHLTIDGNLELKDGGESVVWSTNTSGRSVSYMNLTCEGNLILVNDKGDVVWQSFDHPTDTWLPGQSLRVGQRLTSRASTASFSNGLFYVSPDTDFNFLAFVDTNPPAQYDFTIISHIGYNISIEFYNRAYIIQSSSWPNSFTYFRMEADGHLNLFQYVMNETLLYSALEGKGSGYCGYPLACGSYGICFGNNYCSCPQDIDSNFNYFRQDISKLPDFKCVPVNPLSCSDTHKPQTFLRLDNVTYFGFESYLYLVEVDVDSCKRACLRNCSCAAALFHYNQNHSLGNCSLPSQLLTLQRFDPFPDPGLASFAFVKVQSQRNSSLVPKLVPPLSAGFVVLIVFSAVVCYYLSALRRKANEGPSDLVIDTVMRFSFETLKLATHDFQNRLGRGGFGTVFQGTLPDGKKVAVKSLDSVRQGRKEFLAEVNTIGTLHHFNLVKLIGYCEEGIHRLLVYEYMVNGSLDKWIFRHDQAPVLTWALRQKIICGIAKGLEYLHEDCNQNVIHFDIKPQNILLDRDFQVKIADFGLAKLVDRDESQVMTIIKGTPGYIAPELIAGQAISAKVDVYSFGVLALEIVCGCKNVGSPEEECLANLVKLKADEDRLIDLVDMRTRDMQENAEEAVKVLKIAIWCLQPHFIRPTMSMVVKVLQDLPAMETLADHSYLTITHEAFPTTVNPAFSRPTESLLSGPR